MMLPGEEKCIDLPSTTPKRSQKSNPTLLYSPTPHHPCPHPIMSRCKWSPWDWSCAYDSIFMVLFYMYHHAGDKWRTSWRDNNPLTSLLAMVFQEVGSFVSALGSQELFNELCDQLQDCLLSMDLSVFPWVEPTSTSVTTILEYLCAGAEPVLSHIFLTPPLGVGVNETLPFSLPWYYNWLHWHISDQATMDLQIWCNLWFQRQEMKLSAVTWLGIPPTFPFSIGLSWAPPVLFCEIAQD